MKDEKFQRFTPKIDLKKNKYGTSISSSFSNQKPFNATTFLILGMIIYNHTIISISGVHSCFITQLS